MRTSTVDQQRAKFALGKIEGVLKDLALREKRQKFLIELRHLPAALHWGGLGQTAASLLTEPEKPNEKSPRHEIHRWLQEWLRQRIYSTSKPTQPTLMQAITGSDGFDDLEGRYVAATREARALAVWLKKFGEAFLREPEGDKKKGAADAAAAS